MTKAMFRHILTNDREAAASLLAHYKVEEWMEDGPEEVARCLKGWIISKTDLGNDDTIVDLATPTVITDY